MKYDFESILDRAGKDAIAVDLPTNQAGAFKDVKRKEGFDVIPMWVADMNFPACPTIAESIIERVNHPTYGYFEPREEYFDSIIQWHKTRNNVEGLEKKHIGYENGVLGGVISALNVLASKGDNVLLNSPTYIGFTHALENNGYNMVLSPLKLDENNVWRMDYEDMEKWVERENGMWKEENLTDGYVPSTTLVAKRRKDGRIVAMISIRHRLNHKLLKSGGNIGYSVRPSERRKGYGKKMVSLSSLSQGPWKPQGPCNMQRRQRSFKKNNSQYRRCL